MKTSTNAATAEVSVDRSWQIPPRSRRGPSARTVAPSPFPTLHKPQLPASLLAPRRRQGAEPLRSEPSARLGEQVRLLRIAAGLSGGELSLRSSMSRSMLSRIENGLVSPSVELIDRIAQALGVPLSRFFADTRTRADLSFVPAGQGIKVDRLGAVAGFQYELLGHLLAGNLFVEPYLVQVDAQAQPCASFQHPGVKFVYMVSGRVDYCYGNQTQTLVAGDALLFDATALHGVGALVDGPASYLSIVFTLRG